MIVVWGLREDPPTAAVLEALERRGSAYVFLDQRRGPPDRWSFTFGRFPRGTFGWTCPEPRAPSDLVLSAVHSAYVRPYDDARLPELAERLAAPTYGEQVRRFHECMLTWLEVTPALVVTRSSAQASNASKPLQQRLLRQVGFATPPTLVTTDPAAARAFVRRHREVVYKSVSSVRSVVSRLGTDELDRLDEVAGCPTLLQAHVPGIDHRVHVVGDQVFACVVGSTADDYRYDSAASRSPVALAGEVAERCVAAARHLALPFAGIDLRLTPEGRWVCFEANPSPGFPYYERDGRTDIADAVADLLARGPSSEASRG